MHTINSSAKQKTMKFKSPNKIFKLPLTRWIVIYVNVADIWVIIFPDYGENY